MWSGAIVEALADHQKSSFKFSEAGKNRWQGKRATSVHVMLHISFLFLLGSTRLETACFERWFIKVNECEAE